jgi:26S proteasome regulatory subunit N1
LISKEGAAGLLILSILMTNVEEFIVNKNHYMLSYLGMSLNPKHLCIVDEKLQDLQISVRVGQAVDTVSQVGKPR